jgi:hypothetical protein
MRCAPAAAPRLVTFRLDSLQHAVISGSDDAKKQAMCNLALRLTANENMWLSRIILKEMKIGANANEKTIYCRLAGEPPRL